MAHMNSIVLICQFVGQLAGAIGAQIVDHKNMSLRENLENRRYDSWKVLL